MYLKSTERNLIQKMYRWRQSMKVAVTYENGEVLVFGLILEGLMI